MSKTLVSSQSVTLSGDGWGGAPLFSETVTDTAALVPSSVTLAAGNNTIAVPASALGVVLVPPPSSTNAKVLKGANADTGIALAPGLSTRVMFSAAGAVASFVLNSAAIETLGIIWV
jgi:hypothetical protein